MNASASGTCRVYDGHYLVGNYYQWNAATAGSGAGKYANASICPKGWRLPTLSTTSQDGFGFTLREYGVSDKLVGTNEAGDIYNIALSPLFFVRSGSIAPNATNKFGGAGQYGLYWSSRGYSSTDLAYRLYFNNSLVSPSDFGSRYYGYSLRCLTASS